MYNVRIRRIVFELCLSEKKKKKKKEEERRKKMNKIDIFAFGFLDLAKG